ncbi:MAG: coenzyme F420-0:L-glutamate ligase [Natrialbaceae archaeon]|nr:coenzyme F420-0:L-glutamate ligase [Natrialbaceae archaeon]
MELFPVPEVPEIRPGDDIGAIIADRVEFQPGDVLAVASTVVSKAEDRGADLDAFPAGERATAIARRLEDVTGESKDPRFAQAVLDESAAVLLEAPFLLTKTHFGHVSVNAGIDRSNVPEHDLLLLPRNPSQSAERIRAGLETEDVDLIVTDTCGRPFRHGQRGVALGWSGLAASRDWRGEIDRTGRPMDVTVQAVVDELAAAANLLAGEGAGGTPAIVIRDWSFGDFETNDSLFRDIETDFVHQALRNWRYEP